MQQKRLDNILYVFQVEPYIITDDIEDVSYIYVEQDSLDGFQEINPELKLTGWNYSMYSVFEPPYAKYINPDDLVMEFENTSINVSTYVDEDYTGTVQDVSYTPEDASVTFTYFLGDTSLNSSTFTLDSSGSYTITAKLDPNEIYDEQEASYSLIYQKEKRQETLEFYSSPVVEISGEEGEIEILQVPTLTISPELPETIDWESYVQYTINDDPVISPDLSYEITVVEGVTDYVVKAILNNCPYIENTSTSMIYRVTGESSDYSKKYLTIEPLEAGTFSYTKGNSALSDISYSFDGNTWTQLAPNTNLNIVAEQNIMLKANQPTGLSRTGVGKLNYTGNYNVSGNVMSLLYGDNYQNQTDIATKNIIFGDMFMEQTKLINAENLVLPATNLIQDTYIHMFKNCSNLLTPPIIAKNAVSGTSAFWQMFMGCRSLTETPDISTITLRTSCFCGMFSDCTSLTEAPELPATTLNDGCYAGMFMGCTSLTEAPELPATTLNKQCYSEMFSGCTSLTEAPELPATTARANCYYRMFKNCTSLTNAPELLSSTLQSQCYNEMFSGCSTLNFIESNNSAFNSYMNAWTLNVAATGTFVLGYGDQNYWNTTGVVYGPNGIPTGWVVKDANGNTFTPKTALNLTWAGDPLTNTVFQNSQFTWNYAVTPSDITNITYSISQDGGTTWYNLGNQPGSINPDTSTIGTTNFKVKVEIANDPKYVDKTQIFNGSTTVVEAPDLDLSHYTRLDLIDPTLLQTSSTNFHDVILDYNITWATTAQIELKNLRTGNTTANKVYTITNNNANLLVDSKPYKINEVGIELPNNSDFYAYKFLDEMQIWAMSTLAKKNIVYFKIPINGLRVYYNIADPTQEVTLFNGGGSSSSSSSESSSESGGGGTLPTSMKVDGVSETPINTWRFSTAGEHIVEYGFADNKVPAMFLLSNNNVTKIIVGNDITYISDAQAGSGCFMACSNLTDVVISDSVGYIGTDAFYNCTSLKTVTIGTGIVNIASVSFRGCSSLESIKILATTPPQYLGADAFTDTNNCPIYVPANSVTAYQTATNWSTYASRIQAIS